jgi:hypothetical protein
VDDGDLASEIALLKQQPSKDILAHGLREVRPESGELGLIYEYRLIVHPAALAI